MNISKSFSGQCPFNSATNTINVDYIEASALDSPTNIYIRSRFSCENAMKCQFASNCPVYKNTPRQI